MGPRNLREVSGFAELVGVSLDLPPRWHYCPMWHNGESVMQRTGSAVGAPSSPGVGWGGAGGQAREAAPLVKNTAQEVLGRKASGNQEGMQGRLSSRHHLQRGRAVSEHIPCTHSCVTLQTCSSISIISPVQQLLPLFFLFGSESCRGEELEGIFFFLACFLCACTVSTSFQLLMTFSFPPFPSPHPTPLTHPSNALSSL